MKTIADILKKSGSLLSKLINKAESSQDLEIMFRTALDNNLTKHCHFANYKNSELTVTVTNASIATRLRFAIPDIIKRLRIQPEFKDITNIRYAIVATRTPITKPRDTKTKLSPNNEILWQKTLSTLRKK
jgi:hypothetical protein